MELLFAKAPNNGSTEMKSLLGFIDADIKFEKIKPDVITATSEMRNLIGIPMYEDILGMYVNNSSAEEDKHLLYLTRYPIAIRAYMLLAPNMDVAHTSAGRKMRQDTNEKQAFEWMLDRDNIALEKRYYRALDDLLQYLDESIPEWKSSDAYKASQELFVRTTGEFTRYFDIDSRLILQKLSPGIRKCEREEILPRIGQTKYDALKTALKDSTALTEQDKQLLDLVREACVYYALAWSMMRLSVHIFPEGILQAYTSDRMSTQGKLPTKKMEAEAARQAFRDDAADIFLKIETHVAPPAAPATDCDSNISPDIISGDNYIST